MSGSQFTVIGCSVGNLSQVAKLGTVQAAESVVPAVSADSATAVPGNNIFLSNRLATIRLLLCLQALLVLHKLLRVW